MTDNEPTVRYWRHRDGLGAIYGAPVQQYGIDGEPFIEVHVLTEAELAAHTTAARAAAWDEGYGEAQLDLRQPWAGGPSANPYRSTESED